MNDPLDGLSPTVISAFTQLFPDERFPQRLRSSTLRQAKWQAGTVTLELLASGVVLRLSRDCPFGEISPAYLAIFVHRLAELCPEVQVAYLTGYYHPIVATLPLLVPHEDSVAGWTAVIQPTLARLADALAKQNEAADRLSDSRLGGRADQWPEVEVTLAQLQAIGQLAADFAQAQADGTVGQLRDQEERLRHVLRRFDVLQPGRPWLDCLRLAELHAGFWGGVQVEGFTASQLVVTLNALYQGNLYNTTLVHRACMEGLLAKITARAAELAQGADPIVGA